MKILFYINALSRGGAERVLANLANQFERAGNQVVFINSYPVENEYKLSNNIQHIYLEGQKSNIGRLRKNIYYTRALRKIIKQEQPDVAISFLPEAIFRLLIAVRGLNVKTVISIRNDPNKEYESKSYKLLQKLLYSKADGIVFQTKAAKEWFPKRIQEKSQIILNQVDERFYAVQRQQGEYYCAIGRFMEQKNYKMMIDGFCDFVKEHSEEKLYIYGQGCLQEQMQSWIAEKGVENNIKLMGITDNVPEVLSKAKGFLMTSDYEGMPNALMEAMAVGVPCISTDCPCGGPKSLIEDGVNGLLIPTKDITALTMAIERLHNHADFSEQLGKAAKQTAKTYQPVEIFKEWENYIQGLFSKNK